MCVSGTEANWGHMDIDDDQAHVCEKLSLLRADKDEAQEPWCLTTDIDMYGRHVLLSLHSALNAVPLPYAAAY